MFYNKYDLFFDNKIQIWIYFTTKLKCDVLQQNRCLRLYNKLWIEVRNCIIRLMFYNKKYDI